VSRGACAESCEGPSTFLLIAQKLIHELIAIWIPAEAIWAAYGAIEARVCAAELLLRNLFQIDVRPETVLDVGGDFEDLIFSLDLRHLRKRLN